MYGFAFTIRISSGRLSDRNFIDYFRSIENPTSSSKPQSKRKQCRYSTNAEIFRGLSSMQREKEREKIITDLFQVAPVRGAVAGPLKPLSGHRVAFRNNHGAPESAQGNRELSMSRGSRPRDAPEAVIFGRATLRDGETAGRRIASLLSPVRRLNSNRLRTWRSSLYRYNGNVNVALLLA
jgi:hypothetical protein